MKTVHIDTAHPTYLSSVACKDFSPHHRVSTEGINAYRRQHRHAVVPSPSMQATMPYFPPSKSNNEQEGELRSELISPHDPSAFGEDGNILLGHTADDGRMANGMARSALSAPKSTSTSLV